MAVGVAKLVISLELILNEPRNVEVPVEEIRKILVVVATVNKAAGVVVAIPTLPEASILILSKPAVVKPKILAPALKRPVPVLLAKV